MFVWCYCTVKRTKSVLTCPKIPLSTSDVFKRHSARYKSLFDNVAQSRVKSVINRKGEKTNNAREKGAFVSTNLWCHKLSTISYSIHCGNPIHYNSRFLIQLLFCLFEVHKTKQNEAPIKVGRSRDSYSNESRVSDTKDCEEGIEQLQGNTSNCFYVSNTIYSLCCYCAPLPC